MIEWCLSPEIQKQVLAETGVWQQVFSKMP